LFAKMFLGEGYNVKKCLKHFYPQLILFFLKFIDVYDQSLKGRTVEEFMTNYRDPTKSKEEPSEKEKVMAAVGQQMLKSFGMVEFWEGRYSNVDESTYDWYFTWDHIKEFIYENVTILEEATKDSELGEKIQVLQIGCGNSALSEDLWDEGIKNPIGIDFSEKIIDIMIKRKDLYSRESLSYYHMDARGLNFDEDRFDVIIDKGCIDSMICTEDTGDHIRLTMSEISRVMKSGGYFILISCGINELRSNYINMKNFKLDLITSTEIRGRTGLEVDINLLIFKKE